MRLQPYTLCSQVVEDLLAQLRALQAEGKALEANAARMAKEEGERSSASESRHRAAREQKQQEGRAVRLEVLPVSVRANSTSSKHAVFDSLHAVFHACLLAACAVRCARPVVCVVFCACLHVACVLLT
jgi:hypothetical protein